MEETMARPVHGDRLALCVDAFLYTGTLFLLTQGLAGILSMLVANSAASGAVEAASMVLMVLSLLVGVLLAWRMHGRELKGRSWIGMIAGMVIGGPLTIAAFFALFSLGRFIPNPIPSVEGPWGLVFILLIAVVAFLAMPVLGAIRDLGAGHRKHVRLDWMRLGAFGIVAVTVILTAIYGIQTQSEVAEIGIFMVPGAAAGACAVLGADLFETWREDRARTDEPAPDA
jgi:hypothetical protein